MRSAIEAAIAAEHSALRAAVAAERAADELAEEASHERHPAHYATTPLEPGPCIGCIEAGRCARLLLACSVFSDFVQHGTPDLWPLSRSPSRVEFLAIFGRQSRRKHRRPAGQRSNQELMQRFLVED